MKLFSLVNLVMAFFLTVEGRHKCVGWLIILININWLNYGEISSFFRGVWDWDTYRNLFCGLLWGWKYSLRKWGMDRKNLQVFYELKFNWIKKWGKILLIFFLKILYVFWNLKNSFRLYKGTQIWLHTVIKSVKFYSSKKCALQSSIYLQIFVPEFLTHCHVLRTSPHKSLNPLKKIFSHFLATTAPLLDSH